MYDPGELLMIMLRGAALWTLLSILTAALWSVFRAGARRQEQRQALSTPGTLELRGKDSAGDRA